MPTIIVGVKAEKQEGDLLFLDITYQGQTIEMTVKRDKTLLEMAQLAIDQPFPKLPDIAFDGQVEIDFHTETVVDPETGQESTIKIVDDATKL